MQQFQSLVFMIGILFSSFCFGINSDRLLNRQKAKEGVCLLFQKGSSGPLHGNFFQGKNMIVEFLVPRDESSLLLKIESLSGSFLYLRVSEDLTLLDLEKKVKEAPEINMERIRFFRDAEQESPFVNKRKTLKEAGIKNGDSLFVRAALNEAEQRAVNYKLYSAAFKSSVEGVKNAFKEGANQESVEGLKEFSFIGAWKNKAIVKFLALVQK